jgi:hypothetical protein
MALLTRKGCFEASRNRLHEPAVHRLSQEGDLSAFELIGQMQVLELWAARKDGNVIVV